MAYEVLARKWRPKHFADVIGQEHVTRTLRNAIESKRVAHAYLFVGPRGIGKTTLSRIFAKALNCSAEGDSTAEPCDQCTNCCEIMAGSSLDVIEIDAASNNGVNNIRDIRENAQFAPTNSRYKIFIIDEVHMLSTGAFNALLKTLEEPPPHIKFIFATTEVDKLPATIISRCQRFDLRRIPTALIVKALANICEKEGVKASEDALLAIARGAEGGMRDALSALDQIISFKGNDVTEADVLAVFGLVSRKQIEDLTAAILRGNMADGLRIIDELDQNGKDLRRLVVELLAHFRNLIVRQQVGNDAGGILDVTPEQLKTLDAQAQLADTGRVLRIAEHIADLEDRIRFALSRRTIFETVFLRCCRAASVVSLDQVIRQLSALKSSNTEFLPENSTPATPSLQPPPPSSPAPTPTPNNAPTPAPASSPTQSSILRNVLHMRAGANTPPPTTKSTPVAQPPPSPQNQTSFSASVPPPDADAAQLHNSREDAGESVSFVDASSPFQVMESNDDDDNPIRAAHEPAIKTALKLFHGTITDIRTPRITVDNSQSVQDDPDSTDFFVDADMDSSENL